MRYTAYVSRLVGDATSARGLSGGRAVLRLVTAWFAGPPGDGSRGLREQAIGLLALVKKQVDPLLKAFELRASAARASLLLALASQRAVGATPSGRPPAPLTREQEEAEEAEELRLLAVRHDAAAAAQPSLLRTVAEQVGPFRGFRRVDCAYWQALPGCLSSLAHVMEAMRQLEGGGASTADAALVASLRSSAEAARGGDQGAWLWLDSWLGDNEVLAVDVVKQVGWAAGPAGRRGGAWGGAGRGRP